MTAHRTKKHKPLTWKIMDLTTAVIRENDVLILATSIPNEIVNHKAGYDQVGEYHTKMKQIIQNCSGESMWPCSIDLGNLVIYGIKSQNICFMTVTERNFPRSNIFSFLDAIRSKFLQKYNQNQIMSSIRPYCFIDFDDEIKEAKRQYGNPNQRHQDTNHQQQLNEELNSIQEMVMENIENVINRGKGLSSLDDKALNLKHQSQKYRKDAQLLNRKAAMLKYGLISMIVIIILILIMRYIFV